VKINALAYDLYGLTAAEYTKWRNFQKLLKKNKTRAKRQTTQF
jgi:hypothetical protein